MMDLIVNLYEDDYLKKINIKLKNEQIQIKRILSPNADDLVKFVHEHFNAGWASEVKAGIYKECPTCFIATHNKKIVGFACYDATAKGYFGPTGVDPEYRGNNIGQVLLLKTLNAMRSSGYGYAIIGGVSNNVEGFYKKNLKYVKNETTKDIYSRLVGR